MSNLVKGRCPNCDGRGESMEYGEMIECFFCDGLGVILTEEAKELSQLIQVHIQAAENRKNREE